MPFWDNTQILFFLNAPSTQVINDAALRLAIIAMDETGSAGLSLSRNGSAENELEIPFTVTPAAVEAAGRASFKAATVPL
ncbi:hypothetical protein [Microvirga sp. VF16]|uniref:hypothetical protein n=1 Tax=Microvirga sp. VF16 TaxID=2807101 RepID=UPI00193CFA21|nr:hypothetical protein [Microvirga sp. VF16]QRM32906.1 hypothetical protein JO965_26545 [Microvirga sp. VF16]